MTAGRPSKYANSHTLGIPGEKADHEVFMRICAREQISPADKVNEWIRGYNKVHGDGNPQYTLEQFVDNPNFKAVPALLSGKDKWVKYFDNTDDFRELEEIEQVGDFLRKAARAAKHNKIKEAARALRKQKHDGAAKEALKALPTESDPAAMRRNQLRALFRNLANPLYDRKGGMAHRARRNQTIDHITRLQEMLPEYQRCQDYDEWLEQRKLSDETI